MAQHTESFDIDGQRYEMLVLSGTVVGTDQRSDTRISGAGSIDRGRGSMTIRSSVTVVRDVWLKEPSGQEHHFRFYRDVPVRQGQDVHIVCVRGPGLAPKQKGASQDGQGWVDLALVGDSLNKVWWLRDFGDYALQKQAAIILAVVGFLSLLILIGIPVLIVGIIWYIRLSAQSKREKALGEQLTARVYRHFAAGAGPVDTSRPTRTA
jgi:hypothetical protein